MCKKKDSHCSDRLGSNLASLTSNRGTLEPGSPPTPDGEAKVRKGDRIQMRRGWPFLKFLF